MIVRKRVAWWPLLTALVVVCACSPPAKPGPARGQGATLHARMLVLDSHLDTPVNFGRAGWKFSARHSYPTDLSQVDLPRMTDGGLDGGFFVIFTPQGPLTAAGYADARDFAIRRARGIRLMAEELPGQVGLALTPADARRLAAQGKRVIFQSMENSYPLGDSIVGLADFYDRGVRLAGPVHFKNNQFADSATDVPQWNGLSPLGREWVAEMNRLGMLIDASHASDAAFDQMLALSRTPIILSHSGPKAVFDHPRNIDDARLRALAAKGGVIQINSVYLVAPSTDPAWDAIGEQHEHIEDMTEAQQRDLIRRAQAAEARSPHTTATFNMFMASLLHALKVVGPEHVGIGADWDGGGGVRGMEDVAALPKVTAALKAAGYSDADIEKIWSGNLLRVLQKAEDGADH